MWGTLGQHPAFTATLAALSGMPASSPQTIVMIGVPAGETDGHYAGQVLGRGMKIVPPTALFSHVGRKKADRAKTRAWLDRLHSKNFLVEATTSIPVFGLLERLLRHPLNLNW